MDSDQLRVGVIGARGHTGAELLAILDRHPHVEVALAAVAPDDHHLVGETADLVYHVLLLLKSRNLTLSHVVRELRSRHLARA